VDHEEITIMSTSYKIYVAILAEKLKNEIEERGIIPQNQTGFRKEIRVIDNIYVLNYLINRRS